MTMTKPESKAAAELRQINKELNDLPWDPPLNKAAAILGRKGGLSRSEAKVKASNPQASPENNT